MKVSNYLLRIIDARERISHLRPRACGPPFGGVLAGSFSLVYDGRCPPGLGTAEPKG